MSAKFLLVTGSVTLKILGCLMALITCDDTFIILPEEDAEGESQLLDDDPRLVAKKFNLECTKVSYWNNIWELLSPPTIVMALYCAHHTMNGKREGWTRLRYLNNGDDSRDHDHQVGRLPVVSKTSGDDAECRVSEHAEGGDLASRIQMRKCCRGRRMFLL